MTFTDRPPGDSPAAEPVPGEWSPALDTVITTAVVTAAVVPFVQTLVKKAAEDSYDAVRSLLKRAFRDARGKKGAAADPAKQLLIVKGDDPGVQAVLYAKPDMPDSAIAALAELDLDAITRTGRTPDKLQIFWNESSNQWQIDSK
ncbi:hypothetical protein [Amycolatopsis sp. cmx-4-61]|uniref:hypothetical protein n=1 Tax=Amycolatopsis sp. cmx-4-61 TaxID=2790937 RepID=UPI00397ABBA9